MTALKPQMVPWTVVATGRAVDAYRPVNRHRLMLRILGFAVVVAVVVIVADGLAARQIAQASAVEDTVQMTRVFALDVVQPALGDGVAAGNAVDLARLGNIVRQSVSASKIVRVKIWREDGTIVFSDEARLIGRTFPLHADELKALQTGGIQTGMSNPTAPENIYERGDVPLMKVYLGVHTPNGTRLLLEAYYKYGEVAAQTEALWIRFAAVAAGGVLLMLVGLLPLIRRLIRSLDRGRAQRELLLQKAIDASDTERRRIAALLHDGPVQELIGASHFIGAAGIRMDSTDAGRILDEAEKTLLATIDALRALLLDIYPPDLEERGLAAALDVLAQSARSRGTPVRIELAGDLRLTSKAEKLLFRVARETLANAVKHAEGKPVTISVNREHKWTVLTVTDDGPGFEAEDLIAHPRAGHFGLRMLREAVTEAGLHASLAVRSAPGFGTTWRLEVLT